MSATERVVEVAWHDPLEPRLRPRRGVEVECHLYDEESLEEGRGRPRGR